MEKAKFGVEAEYALVRPDRRFAGFTNTRIRKCGRFSTRCPTTGTRSCGLATPAFA
jgi:hypothetical protein